MKRMYRTSAVGVFSVAALILATAPSAVAGQGAQSTGAGVWEVKVETDKLTDQNVVTSTATVPVSPGSPNLYRLSLRCDGKSRDITLSTWTTTGVATGMMRARVIPWQIVIMQNSAQKVPQEVRLRVDSAVATSDSISYVSDNSARISDGTFEVSQRRLDSSGAMSAEAERALARLQDSVNGKALVMALPKARLIVADVFPDETVEFPFGALAAGDRKTIEARCGFGDGTPTGSVATPTWTDRNTHEPVNVPELWIRAAQPKPLSEYARLATILKNIGSPLVRDQFETSDAFAQRVHARETSDKAMLSDPLVLLGAGGAGASGAFQYDADRGVLAVHIIDANHEPGYLTLSKTTYLSLWMPYPEIVLLMPATPFVAVQPAPKRSLGDVLNRPLNSPRQGPRNVQLPVVCGFPMAPADAKQRMGSLSLLFSVPVSTVLQRDKALLGQHANVSNDLSQAPYGVVIEDVQKIDVWIVDTASHERIAHGPLTTCVVKQ